MTYCIIVSFESYGFAISFLPYVFRELLILKLMTVVFGLYFIAQGLPRKGSLQKNKMFSNVYVCSPHL